MRDTDMDERGGVFQMQALNFPEIDILSGIESK